MSDEDNPILTAPTPEEIAEARTVHRQLETLIAKAQRLLRQLDGKPDFLPTVLPPQTDKVKRIVAIAGEKLGVSERLIFSRVRTAEVARARQLCMVLVGQHLGISSTRVGAIFRRDHCTVLAAQRAIADMRATDKNFDTICNSISQKIQEEFNK